jgi:DnaJ-class molecular chaperone
MHSSGVYTDICELSNKVRQFVEKSYSFEQRAEYKCKKCNGSGLSASKNSDGTSYSWFGYYCNECNGVGYKLIKKINDNLFCCLKCNGLGLVETKEKGFYEKCKSCDGVGFVDWIRNIL